MKLIAESHMPRGTIGIMAVELIYELMSSIASVFNSIATMATMDLYFVITGTNINDVPDSKVCTHKQHKQHRAFSLCVLFFVTSKSTHKLYKVTTTVLNRRLCSLAALLLY